MSKDFFFFAVIIFTNAFYFEYCNIITNKITLKYNNKI